MRKIAVVFPGQGSQCVGMLSGLEDRPSVRETLDEADSILGHSISEIIARGPQDLLNQTVHTQPALVVSCVAIYRALVEKRASFRPTLPVTVSENSQPVPPRDFFPLPILLNLCAYVPNACRKLPRCTPVTWPPF